MEPEEHSGTKRRHEDDQDEEELSDDAGSPNTNNKDDRKRNSRACDPCRRAKSRCEPSLDDGPCKGCIFSGTECTFQGPAQKRGPPKGYINAMESRLHEAEALIGALIAFPRASNLISSLCKDPLADKIITRVNKSVFGPAGRPRSEEAANPRRRGRRRPDKERQRMSTSEVVYSRESGNPIYTSPSYAWQDHLVQRLSAEHEQVTTSSQTSSSTQAQAQAQAQAQDTANKNDSYWDDARRVKQRRLDESSLNMPSGGQNMYYPTSANNLEPAAPDYAATGQLTLHRNLQIRYFGETSGLPLLSRCPRLDSLYLQQLWRIAEIPNNVTASKAARMLFDEVDGQIYLPPKPVQEHLLQQYFHYIHPVLPIVNKDHFWEDWTAMHKGTSIGPAKLLLLAIFALTVKYTDVEEAKTLHEIEYSRRAVALAGVSPSELSTCQTLLLLSYGAIGNDGISDAQTLFATGIQMAFDLGLNQLPDQWTSGGTYVFPENVTRVRKAVWNGYLFLDAFIAVQFGRPPRIRREDYDCLLVEVDSVRNSVPQSLLSVANNKSPPSSSPDMQQEDVQLWMPHKVLSSNQEYTPLPGRITNCFRLLGLLAEFTSAVIQRLYPVRSEKSFAQRNSEAFELDQKLQRWYVELPEGLRITTTSIAPPQILCLHMMYWCTVLLVHRSFLSRQGSSVQTSDRGGQFELHRALDLGATAATNLTNLIRSFDMGFGLQRAPPLIPYYLMISGATHIAVLQVHVDDIQAKMGLTQCLDFLTDIKKIWPAAAIFYDLLHGARVDKTIPPLQRHADSLGRKKLQDGTPDVSFRTPSSSSSEHPGPSLHSPVDGTRPSPFATLTYSLGLDPNALNNVFVPAYDGWPSKDILYGVPDEPIN